MVDVLLYICSFCIIFRFLSSRRKFNFWFTLLYSFFVFGSFSFLRMHHVVNVSHDLSLFWIKHSFILICEVIPSWWITRIIFSKDEYFIISSQLSSFLWIRNYILKCTVILFISLSRFWSHSIKQPFRLEFLLFFCFLLVSP